MHIDALAEPSTSHAALVDRAGRWLRYSAHITETILERQRTIKVRCGVVLTELVTWEEETPDAIGWFNAGQSSILVEVKVSRADFMADQKKRFRRKSKRGVGEYRYYLTLEGLLQPDELPEKWGLLEVVGRQVRVVVPAMEFREYAIDAEKAMMFSALRRVQCLTVNQPENDGG